MPRLFVIMPFGTKQLPAGPYDFDAVYSGMIRPAAVQAGWDVFRIDELPAVGSITRQYLREIVTADLVLAEISEPNANVFYELGVRHAVSSSGTILVARKGTLIPFDLAAERVIFYEFDSAGFRTGAANIRAFLEYHRETPTDNPVRNFLEETALVASPSVDIAAFERDIATRVDRARTAEQLIALWEWVRTQTPLPSSPLLLLAERLADTGEWAKGVEVLRAALEVRPTDFEIHRQLGWFLTRLGPSSEEEGITRLNAALELNPQDPETLGMLGGVFKRRDDFLQAADYYERARKIAPRSLYIAVNAAALRVLSNPDSPSEGVSHYERLVSELEAGEETTDEWGELVLAEALYGVGRIEDAEQHYRVAASLASSPKSLESAASQLELLAKHGFRSTDARVLATLVRGLAKRLKPGTAAPPRRGKPEAYSYPIVIHISDPHFTSGDAPKVHRFDNDPSGMSLSEHIIEDFTSLPVKCDSSRLHLVVSGDLTWSATDHEFDRAHQCLDEITAGLDIPTGRVHIVPGNHDVNWNLARDEQSRRFDNYLRFLGRFYGPALMRQKFPAISWPVGIDEERPLPGAILTLTLSSDDGLLIAGLNSCVYENEEHHYGYIGDKQLKLLRNQLTAPDVQPDAVRIAVMHHHLHPFPEYLPLSPAKELWTDVSTLRDAGIVERVLEKLGFDLVLHGHKHRAQTRETLVREPGPQKYSPQKLIVCGAGSVSCLELEHAVPNQYEVIEFMQVPRRPDAQFVRVLWRTLDVAPGAEWVTSQTWDIPG